MNNHSVTNHLIQAFWGGFALSILGISPSIHASTCSITTTNLSNNVVRMKIADDHQKLIKMLGAIPAKSTQTHTLDCGKIADQTLIGVATTGKSSKRTICTAPYNPGAVPTITKEFDIGLNYPTDFDAPCPF